MQRYLHEVIVLNNDGTSQTKGAALDSSCVLYLVHRHELQLHGSELGSMEADDVINAHACSFHHNRPHPLPCHVT